MTRQSYPEIEPTPPVKTFPPFGQIGKDGLATRVQALSSYVARLEEFVRRLADVANGARRGKLNSVGTVTWTESSTTTTLTDPLIGPNSYIGFNPTTANAGTLYGDGGWYISSKTNGSAVITHTSAANSDLTFEYIVIGG